METTTIRTNLHAMWGAVAPAWGEHADFIDQRAADVTETMIGMAGAQPGERVLELACGPGGLGLAVAAALGPDSEVVLSDIAPAMTAIAAARAEERGLASVSTHVLDIEEIDQPDASYDVVLSREGFMFAVDPAAAAREIARVLRPGGRVVLAVWGARARNPWLGIVMDSVGEQLGAPVPPPGIPGPFALDDPERLESLLTAAGLDEVEISEAEAPMRVPSFEDWWSRTTALAGPVSKLFETLPAEAVEAIRVRAEEASRAYATADGLEFPAVTMLARGRRA